ncbi:DUF4350 domain-containing protein [Nocardioides sp. Soil805]|uniref:DUF4350 domain-containing protein n=1 Tax=Nocardioides sp. Soil805 TaxID=1736416 RepID=UPI00070273E9|nr:DUF4350 domain-containing protein [Nocardioides sp. Soil805]KRF35191.1 hypothetical protein ASG94_13860 [Nocardioides sp. Soil805]
MRGLWERHRTAALIGAGTLVALATAVLLGTAPGTSAIHDPDNPGGTGARAVARVLADEGVDVEVARSASALEDTAVDAGTTVLVTSPDNLGRSTARRLLAHAGSATVVVADPGPGAVEALGVEVDGVGSVPDAPRGAGCTDAALDDALRGLAVDVDRATDWPTTTGCFGGRDGWWLASADDGLLLLGAPGILENDQVLRADNATVALRLLGRGDRLVWYVPDLADLAADDGVSLRTLLPPWLVPAVWMAGLAMVAVVWWRGRRLGPLATEPLPVTVRALETTHARGRLYRDADDRAHAARALRRHSRAAAAAHLRLPTDDGDTLVRDVARAVARPGDEVAALLDDSAPPPRTDEELIRLADSLAALDREVRAT